MGAKGKLMIAGAGVLLVCTAWMVISYYRLPVNSAAIAQQTERIHNPFNTRQIDSATGLLQNGDIVVRTGADITSYMFTQFNQKDKTYSHCGIVHIEHGYPFVYHSIGGEDNPDQRIRKDSVRFWFSPANNLGFGIVRFDADSSGISRVVHTAERYYGQKRMFDMDFDLRTDDRLYCAEFVYKVWNTAMKDSNFITPSRLFGYTFVAVDNLFLNSHARFICQVRYK